MVKVEVEREGVQTLLEEFGPKLRKITVLFENSQEGPEEEGELGKHISLLLQAKESSGNNGFHILHCEQYSVHAMVHRYESLYMKLAEGRNGQ